MIQVIRQWLQRNFSDPQIIILAFLLVAGFVLVFSIGHLMTPVFISIIVAYLLEGIVVKLEELKMPRTGAVILVFIGFSACLIVLFIWLIPILSRQVMELIQELPDMLARTQHELMQLPQKYPRFISESQIQQITSYLTSELTRAGQYVLTLSLASVRGLITFLVYMILVPLMIFFFLKDKEMIINWLAGFLPKERRLAGEVWQEVNLQIGNYVRGKIWEILIVWSVTYVTFRVFFLPFTMLLSLFVGLSVLIPYIGATIMFLPVALIAFFEWGWSVQLHHVSAGGFNRFF